MLESFFYWSGVVVWFFISTLFLLFLCLVFLQLWSRIFRPCMENLCFAIFGKGYRNKDISYYKLWSGMARTRNLYRYHAKGQGRKNFGRLALKRLVCEARKESRRKSK